MACQKQDGVGRFRQKDRRFGGEFDFMSLYFEYIM